MTKTPRTYEQVRADVAALLSLILPLLLLAFFFQPQRISMNPASAVGVVENKRVSEGAGEGPDHLFVRYSFTAWTGQMYRGEGSVGRRLYDKIAVGDRLEIEYAADDPGNSRVRGEFDPQVWEALGVVALGILLFLYLGPRRWLRTLRGEPDPGPFT